MRRATPLLLVFLTFACDRSIVLGDLAEPGAGGGGSAAAGAGGATGTGGAATGEAGAAGSVGAGGALVFSSDFETGDFSEWGLEGNTLNQPGGVMSVVSDVAHAGSSSLYVSTEAHDEIVELVLPADYTAFRFGFWLRIDDTYATNNWVILNIDESMPDGGVQELFDLAITAPNGEPRFLIFEKPTLNATTAGEQIAEATDSFALGGWVHVEVELRVAADATGALSVDQNEERVIDLPGRPTRTDGTMRLSLGSFASGLEPLPAHFWLDDVTLERL